MYQWVTECLYAPPKLGEGKILGVALKSIAYFNYGSIHPENGEEVEKIKQRFPNVEFGKTPYDLVLMDRPDKTYIENLSKKGQLHNNSIIIIKDIHSNSALEKRWNSLVKSKQLTISVDLFYCGVLFLRKEQEKEHFNIRI